MEMYHISVSGHKISVNLFVILLHIIRDWKIGNNITEQGKDFLNLVEYCYIFKSAHISLLVKILTWKQ